MSAIAANPSPVTQLLKRADAALYAAKHAGRNRVQAAESGAKN